MSASVANPFKRAAQLKKADALVERLDRELYPRWNPLDRSEAAHIALLLEQHCKDEHWLGLARRAGVNASKPPSQETRTLVIDRYRERAAGGRAVAS